MLEVVYINLNYEESLKRAGVLSEDAIWRWDRGRQIVKKNWADVFRWTSEGLGTVYVKRYFRQRNRLLGAFRRSLAVRELEGCLALQRLGIPQPEPVLTVVIKNKVGLALCGLYMIREVEGAISLDRILEQMRGKPDKERLEGIVRELVRLLQVMHQGNFFHWDFKPRNLLVAQKNGAPVITPIDPRSGKKIALFRRRHCIERDWRFLLREPLLRPLLETLYKNESARK